MSFKVKELKPVAIELNEHLGLEKREAIKTVAVKATKIEADIISVCEENEGEISFDELSPESIELLKELGVYESTEASEEEDDYKDDYEEIDDDQEEEDDDDQEEEEEEEEDDDDQEEEDDDDQEEEEEVKVPKLPKSIQKNALKVASDLVKTLDISDDSDGKKKNPMVAMKKLSAEKLHQQIVEMSKLIGQPYEDENGETQYPQETKENFSDITLEYFEAAGIEPDWPKTKKTKAKAKGKKEKTKEKPEKSSKKSKKKKDSTPATKKGGKKSDSKKKSSGSKAKGKKSDEPKTKFGHRLSKQSGLIDEMVIKGTTMKKLIDKLGEVYDLNVAKAKARIKDHFKHLEEAHDVEFKHDKKKDSYKIK